MEPDVIIVGGSVRAAAGSARRAGLRPWCADLYADLDTRALARGGPPGPLRRFADLASILPSAPEVPWFYTGCLENHPNLVARLAALRPLWGNDGNTLSACRSPFRLARLLREAGLAALEVGTPGGELSKDRRWVRKPVRSCGGHGIEYVRPGVSSRADAAHYFQEFAEGTPMSAVYCRTAGRVHCLGMTEQLVSRDWLAWLNAPPFAYAGSIGPIDPSDGVRREVIRIGELIGEQCRLRGLFGVDFICRDGRPWVVEVNPRYTASIEVLERALGICALALHRQAFYGDALPAPGRTPRALWIAKGILYAPEPMTVQYEPAFWDDAIQPALGADECDRPIGYADLPANGAAVGRSCPILTVLAEGPTRAECEILLRRGAAEAFAMLQG